MIEARSVRKRYRTVTAVDGVSFRAEPGQVVALLGANGAGKTSLIRMIVGITRPDEGALEVQAGASGHTATRFDVGYLPEERGLQGAVPIRRTMVFYGVLRGLPRAEAGARADRWLARLGLADRGGERLDALSKGNQQKVQLATTLIHDPSVVVLDEPFSGLDPLNQELLIEWVKELRDRRATILLSAHQMALVERLADRVLFLRAGRVVADGTLDELRAQVAAEDLQAVYMGLARA